MKKLVFETTERESVIIIPEWPADTTIQKFENVSTDRENVSQQK